MKFTPGEMLFYSGIAGMVIVVVASIIASTVFFGNRKLGVESDEDDQQNVLSDSSKACYSLKVLSIISLSFALLIFLLAIFEKIDLGYAGIFCTIYIGMGISCITIGDKTKNTLVKFLIVIMTSALIVGIIYLASINMK